MTDAEREIERMKQMIAMLEPRLEQHLACCRFCQAHETCDTRGGYECAIKMHRACINSLAAALPKTV